MYDSDLSFEDLVAPVTDLGHLHPLEHWIWLTGRRCEPLLLTAAGDLFYVQRRFFRENPVFLLDTCDGRSVPIAPSYAAFKAAVTSPENVGGWFRPQLVASLRSSGLVLGPGQCYSPIQPPIIGGSLDASNFEATSWRVHLAILGQIHRQVKDLPPGTPINGIDLQWSD